MPEWATDIASHTGYWTMIALFLVGAVAAWSSNFLTLPGNWLVVALAIGAFFVTTDDGRLISLGGLVALAALAGIGEGVEFLASAAGAAKQGASKRGLALSVAGAMGGSIAGAMLGAPVPFLGPLVGAILGGAAGAFVGAYLGEAWKKAHAHDDRLTIARAAFEGRLLGTVGKLLVGSVMLVVFGVALFV